MGEERGGGSLYLNMTFGWLNLFLFVGFGHCWRLEFGVWSSAFWDLYLRLFSGREHVVLVSGMNAGRYWEKKGGQFVS